jgi:hypothetical protein
MENYIVRVYRRGQNDPDEVAGLVETVGTDEKRAFKSFSGLVAAIRWYLTMITPVMEWEHRHKFICMISRPLVKRHGG